MCTFKFNKVFCPDCRRDDEDIITIPRDGSPCKWAKHRRAQPINCRCRHLKWSGEWSMKTQPCIFCGKEREVSSDKVKRWAKKEEAWREQNPLEDRVGENIPEADRGWRTPSIHEDDVSTTTEEEPRRNESNSGSEIKRKKLKLVKTTTRRKN